MRSKKHKWNVADTVTSARIAGCLFLLVLPLKSIWFLVVLQYFADSSFPGFVSDTSGSNLVCRIWNRTCSSCSVCNGSYQISLLCIITYMAEQVNRCSGIPLALCSFVFVGCCIQLDCMHFGICCGSGGTGNPPFEGRVCGGQEITIS